MTVDKLINLLAQCNRKAEVFVSENRDMGSGESVSDVVWEMQKKEVTIVTGDE